MFDIRRLEFYQNRNTFTGSCDRFRYRIQPEEAFLRVCYWRENVCYELANKVTDAEFPLTEEGFQQMIDWLEQQYQSIK